MEVMQKSTACTFSGGLYQDLNLHITRNDFKDDSDITTSVSLASSKIFFWLTSSDGSSLPSFSRNLLSSILTGAIFFKVQHSPILRFLISLAVAMHLPNGLRTAYPRLTHDVTFLSAT